MRACLFVLLGAALAAEGDVATRIARFLDTQGVERYGQRVSSSGGPFELIAGDIFQVPHLLTGVLTNASRVLAPVSDIPAIYAIGLNYPDHAHR
jgi:hypothetical protein